MRSRGHVGRCWMHVALVPHRQEQGQRDRARCRAVAVLPQGGLPGCSRAGAACGASSEQRLAGGLRAAPQHHHGARLDQVGVVRQPGVQPDDGGHGQAILLQAGTCGGRASTAGVGAGTGRRETPAAAGHGHQSAVAQGGVARARRAWKACSHAWSVAAPGRSRTGCPRPSRHSCRAAGWGSSVRPWGWARARARARPRRGAAPAQG